MPNTQSPATLAPLTEEQKASAACPPHFSTGQQYTRAEASAIEAAHRQQPDPLSEGMPEPFDYCYEWDGHYGTRKFSAASHNGRSPTRSVAIYTTDQLRAQHAAGRRQGLEEAAKVCEERMNKTAFELEAERCAAAIRDLIKD